jgi:uncharacterized protein (DUF58 family)
VVVTVDRIPGITIDVDELIAVRARLDRLTLRQIRRHASTHSDARAMRLRGRGMEYEESRAYVFGDDVRTLDWRVMARTGEAHTKLFAEEKERASLIAVDLSASMFYGTRFAFKSWAAAQLAAHLGWLASFAGERIGGLVVSSAHHAEVRPGKTRSGLLGMFHHLALADQRRDLSTAGASRLNFMLRELRRVARPGSDIVLISDFLGIDRDSLQALSMLTRHNRLYHYWIHDDSEINDWPRGSYPIRNEQGSAMLELDDSQQRASLKRRQQQNRQRVESLCSSFGIPLLPISCNRDITRQLLQVLHPRP